MLFTAMCAQLFPCPDIIKPQNQLKESTFRVGHGCALVILALRRLRQEDLKFQTSLGYTMRPCLKNKTTLKIPNTGLVE
jgi:hypothetical protein